MGEMDAMLQGLRAAPLENVGLVEALKQACEALSFRIGARVDFVPGRIPSSLALPPGAQDAVFRGRAGSTRQHRAPWESERGARHARTEIGATSN